MSEKLHNFEVAIEGDGLYSRSAEGWLTRLFDTIGRSDALFTVSFIDFCSLGLTIAASASDGVRLKDLAEIDGIRDNQLVGFGLVVGLSGTGDDADATNLAQRLLTNMRQNFNVEDLENDNIAMVMVTADLPPFTRSGARIPQVGTIGDADSLRAAF